MRRRLHLTRELRAQPGTQRTEQKRLLLEAREREMRATMDLRDAAVYVAGVAGHRLAEEGGCKR